MAPPRCPVPRHGARRDRPHPARRGLGVAAGAVPAQPCPEPPRAALYPPRTLCGPSSPRRPWGHPGTQLPCSHQGLCPGRGGGRGGSRRGQKRSAAQGCLAPGAPRACHGLVIFNQFPIKSCENPVVSCSSSSWRPGAPTPLQSGGRRVLPNPLGQMAASAPLAPPRTPTASPLIPAVVTHGRAQGQSILPPPAQTKSIPGCDL